MKNALRIWFLAIVFQTLLFFCMLMQGEADSIIFLMALIPIELIGGLPGLFLFSVTMKQLQRSSLTLATRWLFLALAAPACALLTSMLTGLFFGANPASMFHTDSFLLYAAPIAASLSLLCFIPSTNRYLNEHTTAENP